MPAFEVLAGFLSSYWVICCVSASRCVIVHTHMQVERPRNQTANDPVGDCSDAKPIARDWRGDDSKENSDVRSICARLANQMKWYFVPYQMHAANFGNWTIGE